MRELLGERIGNPPKMAHAQFMSAGAPEKPPYTFIQSLKAGWDGDNTQCLSVVLVPRSDIYTQSMSSSTTDLVIRMRVYVDGQYYAGKSLSKTRGWGDTFCRKDWADIDPEKVTILLNDEQRSPYGDKYFLPIENEVYVLKDILR